MPYSPAAQLLRGSLFAYLKPRLAMDAQPHAMKMVDRAVQGVTSRNYRQSQPKIVNALRRVTQGRLAQDNGIEDLAALLGALAPGATEADQAPGLGQIASNPGGGAGGGAPPMDQPPGLGAPGQMTPAGGNVVELITKYLTEEGVAPEIINNLPAIIAGGGGGGAPGGMDSLVPRTQPGQDQDPIEGEPGGESLEVMEPRGGGESDWRTESASDADPAPIGELPPGMVARELGRRGEDEGHEGHDPWSEAEDDITPGEQSEQMGGVAQVSGAGTGSRVVNGGGQDRAVTKSAMDHAIRVAQDAAIKNQRAIRDAERFVRPWVGDIAMDSNHPADVYRAALKALGVKGAEKLHPDALRPVLEAQPRPGAARVMQRRQNGFAQDSNVTVQGDFASRFPDAMKVTTMQ